MDMTGGRLGCPFPKCYPVEYQDVVNPCTNRPGFDGFRLLNEHIWKYHSFKYHCHICLKRFTTAAHEKVAKIVEAHMVKEHSSSRRSSTSTSSSSSRTLKSSSSRSSPKRRRHSPNSSSSDESTITEDGIYYGGAFYNMTLEQDKAFLEWQEKERKVKNLDTAKKYQDLVKALFGTRAAQPDSPYFDYLVPKHLVTDYVMDDFNRRLAAMGFESLEELEADYATKQNTSPLNRTFATTRMAAARGMPEPSYTTLDIPAETNEHLSAMYDFQNPYAALYPMGGAVDEAVDGGEADGGEFTGLLPGTHAPHHHHASTPYHSTAPPHRRPASTKPSHHKTSTTSWSISNTGPDSGYASVEIDSECPQTSGGVGAPVGGMLDISGMGGCFAMGADGLMHSGLRPEMRNATFNQSAILGLDRIDEHYQMAPGWAHPVTLEEF